MYISVSELTVQRTQPATQCSSLRKSLNGLAVDSRMKFKFFSMSFKALPSLTSNYFSRILSEKVLPLGFSHWSLLPMPIINDVLSCLDVLV